MEIGVWGDENRWKKIFFLHGIQGKSYIKRNHHKWEEWDSLKSWLCAKDGKLSKAKGRITICISSNDF